VVQRYDREIRAQLGYETRGYEVTLFIRLTLPLALAAGCATVAAAQEQPPAPTVTIAAIDPGPSGQLGNEEPLYIKLTYHSEQPVSFQAEGRLRGKVVSGMMGNGLVPQPVGGETLVFIAYRAGAKVDAIKINVFDNKSRVLTSIQAPVDLTWTTAPPRDPSRYADWVPPMKRMNDWRMLEQIASDPQALLGYAIVLTVPAYLVLQFWLAYAWTGAWRVAALVPLVVVLPALTFSLFAFSRGSNLAPLPFFLAAPPSLVYLLIAWVFHRARRPAPA
jgi:hypothetical protein